ncbi:MAG: hypothetical protein A2621_00555 [Alphaproteobacteria bacterium RIFCSPHIGHO2_01_FULL_41_14]|nr:MAG: hypothetical protein A2065_04575 [Alphaproteobacteria bacterium GWB1_45_5]OFW76317.1 MAG: hypothetical protein A3K20_02235 [Alphaproteobacteria bacterium GWA1_45_9]OFW89411.1 MAG: hypothetical protein A2621_00555 [Alphaproteobacteria bacterium RIFCSPHIGHO2_01_FULL_41_14]HCI48695.1 hypothetical protein [Holosporales bacterium]
MLNVSVIGLGAWGSALGVTAHRAGSSVTMIGLPSEVQHVQKTGSIVAFPDNPFPSDIRIDSAHSSLETADIVVCAVPAQLLRTCLESLPNFPSKTPLVIASKGIEQSTGYLMGQVAEEVLVNPIAILSGPNFASEIMRNKPAATTIGCTNPSIGHRISQALAHKNFRPYLNTDVIGVQIGGAVKNVLAIACGIARARGLGENAVASLVTRGIHEMRLFGAVKGGRESTFLGLSGVGDVMLTCMGAQSRNSKFGFDLAQQDSVNIESLNHITVEGFYTAEALQTIIQELNLPMPLCTMVYQILYKNVKIDQAIEDLLNRPLRGEG